METKRRKHGKIPSREKLEDLILDGYSMSDIAKKFGLDRTTVGRLVLEYNIGIKRGLKY